MPFHKINFTFFADINPLLCIVFPETGLIGINNRSGKGKMPIRIHDPDN